MGLDKNMVDTILAGVDTDVFKRTNGVPSQLSWFSGGWCRIQKLPQHEANGNNAVRKSKKVPTRFQADRVGASITQSAKGVYNE